MRCEALPNNSSTRVSRSGCCPRICSPNPPSPRGSTCCTDSCPSRLCGVSRYLDETTAVQFTLWSGPCSVRITGDSDAAHDCSKRLGHAAVQVPPATSTCAPDASLPDYARLSAALLMQRSLGPGSSARPGPDRSPCAASASCLASNSLRARDCAGQDSGAEPIMARAHYPSSLTLAALLLPWTGRL